MMATIVFSYITLVILTKIYLNQANAQAIKEHRLKVPPFFDQWLKQDEHTKASDYTLAKLKFSLVELIFSSALTLLFLLYGYQAIDQTITHTLMTSETYRGLIFFGVLGLLQMIFALPFSLYFNFVLEERFGFNKMTIGTFFEDKLKGLVLALVLATPLLILILEFIQFFERDWWWIAASLVVAFQFFLLWVYPSLIAPLFNKFTPLEDEKIKSELKGLLKKIDLHFDSFYVMDASKRSGHGNAYFTGFGKKRRVVFFDTLLNQLSPNEVMAVMAHELGHLKKNHIKKSFAISIVSTYGLFLLYWYVMKQPWLYSLFEVRPSSYMGLNLMFTLSSFAFFFLGPLTSIFSRKNEYEADTFAVHHSSGEDLISALVGLYKENSSCVVQAKAYSFFYNSHPSARERIDAIQKQL